MLITVKEILEFLHADVIETFGNSEGVSIRHLNPIETVDKETLDWIGKARNNKQQAAEASKAKVILCDPSVRYTQSIHADGKILIHVANPRLAFSLIATRYFVPSITPDIHPSSFISSDAIIDEPVFIGANCSIGQCRIGQGAKIMPNVTIYDGVTIGRNVTIQAGAVIGAEGLGCERQDDGMLVKFPQIGRLKIGDNVEIGANCQIAKGALSQTIIGEGCKINGLCLISHNCFLGKNVWISASTIINGSVIVHDNVTIYSNVSIREKLTIGCGATIGMGAVIVTDVPPYETWVGNPARKLQK